jgi:hypothetical protein
VHIIDNIQIIDFSVTWLKLIAFLQPTSHDATMRSGDTHCVLHAPGDANGRVYARIFSRRAARFSVVLSIGAMFPW